MAPAWKLRPGEQIERTSLHDDFGGGRRGGVEPSAKSPNIFVFSDPQSGEQHGYSDEWKSDGYFHYTGEGRRRNQEMKSGNAAILNHATEGRALRLFDGTGGTITYMGEFDVDNVEPFYLDRAPETENGPLRDVIIFRLRPRDIPSGPPGTPLAFGLDKDELGALSTSQTAFVYVPIGKGGPRNFAIGRENGVWGFRPSTIERAGFKEQFEALREGDQICLGHGGPQPRVKSGGWNGSRLDRVCRGLVTSTQKEAKNRVWPDHIYPYRIQFEIKSMESNTTLDPDSMEALRQSANQRGGPVVIEAGGTSTARRGTGHPKDFELPEALDDFAIVRTRKEQAKLRALILGAAESASCAICGIELPRRHIRIAHIKRRADCSDAEKRDHENVMPACIECDSFFEVGDLIVGPNGVIEAGTKTPTTPKLKKAVQSRVGRSCSAFKKGKNAKYFKFHREKAAKA